MRVGEKSRFSIWNQALPEDLRLMIHFDPEALTDIQMAEAPL